MKEFPSVRHFLDAGYNRWLSVRWVIILAYVELIVEYLITPDWLLSADIPSYFATLEGYLDGTWSGYRTPGYPLFLGLFHWIGNDAVEKFLIITVQKTVHIIACFYLFRLMTLLRFTGKTCFLVTVFLLLVPGVLMSDWDGYMLTESLTCSMFVFFVWTTVRFIFAPSVRPVMWSALWLLLLVFIRPANLYLFPMTALFYISFAVVNRKYRRSSLTGLAMVGVCMGITYGFVRYTDMQTGNGPFSYISTINNIWFIEEAGINDPKYIDDPERRGAYADFIKDCPDANGWTHCTALKYKDPHLADTRKFVRKAIVSEPEKVLKYLGRRVKPFMTYYFVLAYWPSAIRPVLPYIIPRTWIGVAVIFMIIPYGVLQILRGRKKGGYAGRREAREGIIYLWTGALSAGLYFVVFVGAMMDWGRLIYPVMPFVVVFFCQLLRSASTLVRDKVAVFRGKRVPSNSHEV